jgi:hypothetical protein
MKKVFLTLSILIIAEFMVHAAQEEGDALYVDSNGSIIDYQGSSLEPTYQSDSNISILVFNPLGDVPNRLRGLGYNVTETSNPADLNRANLQNFDVLWISAATVPSFYSSQNAEIQAWVNNDGGGLIVNQPNIIAIVSVFPPGYDVSIFDIYWPGDTRTTIVDHSHPITQGLVDDDLSANLDWVRSQDIGANWNTLAVDLETPDDIALLAGEYGDGKLVFNTGNFAGGDDPGSDKYLVQMTDWAITVLDIIVSPLGCQLKDTSFVPNL